MKAVLAMHKQKQQTPHLIIHWLNRSKTVCLISFWKLPQPKILIKCSGAQEQRSTKIQVKKSNFINKIILPSVCNHNFTAVSLVQLLRVGNCCKIDLAYTPLRGLHMLNLRSVGHWEVSRLLCDVSRGQRLQNASQAPPHAGSSIKKIYIFS